MIWGRGSLRRRSPVAAIERARLAHHKHLATTDIICQREQRQHMLPAVSIDGTPPDARRMVGFGVFVLVVVFAVIMIMA
jgi:hypothetical protein